MKSGAALRLTEAAVAAVAAHAREAWPEECCGVILGRGRSGREVHRLPNLQNRLHAKDPETFPRDARTAYTMDPEALAAVLEQAERSGLRLQAFYHSHPDHDAYFSDEDKACATPFGEPTYPDAAQVVVSVMEGAVARMAVYAWDPQAGDFVEAELARVPDSPG